MIKPAPLKKGDKIAAISLSWGGAGELPKRYLAGKKQLEELFNVQVVETKHALKPAEYIAKNPQARASDLMEAFADKSIKAIISNIGGDDSIRILPYIDIEIIRNNPKIFLGSSDDTVTHFLCYKAGLTSFYGPSIMAGFAENGGLHNYQIRDIHQTLFSTKPVGNIHPSEYWTSEFLNWADPSLQNTRRKLTQSSGWNFLQGKGSVQGRLIGGCIEVLEFLKATEYWLAPEHWNNKILFIETSEEMMPPTFFKRILRNYAAQGIFKRINGLIMGRPYNNKYTDEYNEILLEVIRNEQGIDTLPVISEMDFGHTCPVFTIPYGVTARIDMENQLFSISESGISNSQNE
jgi:muramoyltetrapeptide carboxypeptidase LdcA involved in peptidoglycan recycling